MITDHLVANKQDIKLAENLERLLKRQGLTVSAAAKKVGMNKSTLHNYCNGVVPRNLVKLRDLAILLDVSFAELVFGTQSNNKSHEFLLEGSYEVTVKRIGEPLKTQKKNLKE